MDLGDTGEQDIRQHWDASAFDVAITVAIHRYGDELFGFLLGLTGNHDRAGDAFGAMCERAWTGLPRFRWASSVRVWMYAIARNEFLRNVGRARKQVPLSVVPSVAEAIVAVRTRTAPHQRSEVKAEFAKIREALAPEDHMLLGLRLDRRLAWNEIAVIMSDGSPADLAREAATLRKRYERLKVRLKQLAADLLDDESG